MGHFVSGIITSFKYMGDLPHVYLVGNYALIPLSSMSEKFKGFSIAPFEELTPNIKKLARDLSFYGKCAFIETSYHGGFGLQASIVWENGGCVFEPIQAEDAINRALSFMGIRCHDGKDEFDTAHLGWYRSNEEVQQEYISKVKILSGM